MLQRHSSFRFRITLRRLLLFVSTAVSLSGCQPSSPPSPNVSESESQSDSFAAQRQALVDSFGSMRPEISDVRILEAARTVPRHRFVPEAYRQQAYLDRPLPIGHEQTISQPSLVAYMTQLLEPQAEDRILEIGTGSGYQAALLSPLVAEVYSIEIVRPLGERSAALLKELGYDNVHVRIGDGFRGWPEVAPFDAIIVTCAPDAIPAPLIEQLAEGGRLVIPVGETGQVQELYLLEKRKGEIRQQAVLPVRFVPMTGESNDPAASP